MLWGCRSGFGEDEAIGLLKRFYEIGNPRTKAMEAAAAEAAAAAAAEVSTQATLMS